MERNLPIRNFLAVGLYRNHPRVLDAWIAHRIVEARQKFTQNRTYSAREIYFPLPVAINGKQIPELKPRDLRNVCAQSRWCLLIRGEGGVGRTTLACRLALWGMADEPSERLVEDRRMLPVLIEPGIAVDVLRTMESFRREIVGRLQRLVGEMRVPEELANALLSTRRVLVILDGLSEMPTPAEGRAKIHLEDPDFPVAAMVVTSRNDEGISEDATILPSRVDKEHMVGFLNAYISRTESADIKDTDLFGACRRFAYMLSDSEGDATPLLGKMFAERLVALLGTGEALDRLPATIPDLVLGYLNDLNRHSAVAQPDNPTLHRAAQIAAWSCLKRTFRPGAASRTEIRGDLEQAGLGPAVLDDLEHRLGLVRTIAPAQTHVQFVLDPLSEYLAGLQVLESTASSEHLWRQFLVDADQKPGAPGAIRGFLEAVRHCCLARGKGCLVPDFVVEELSCRIGLDDDAVKQARTHRRIQRLIGILRMPEESADRLYAT